MHALGDRVHSIEDYIGEITTTINYLVDAHGETIEEHTKIKAKIADLEDRSRRNNLKLRGIPETVQSADLKKFATDLFTSLLPETPALELTIDRIYCIP